MHQFLLIHLLKGDEIFRAGDRHSIETVILSKCVVEYEQCENGSSNISASFRVVALKLIELIHSRSQTIDFLQCLTCRSSLSDVITSYRFLFVELASASH